MESAQAQADAAAEQRRDALVSSQAELARDYVQLRGTQEQIRIDLANIKVNEQILDVVRIRQQRGLVTGLDTANAAQQVEAIKAQLPQLQQQEIQQINAIALLLGEPPLSLSQELVTGRAIPPVPPRIPVGYRRASCCAAPTSGGPRPTCTRRSPRSASPRRSSSPP